MDKNKDDKETIYEVNKELSVSNIMQLIDINGTKKNFQSQFILETKDPSKKISVCVVNQDELDNGKINFEETERGKYSRRVTFQNDKHVNHYIAVKKHPEDKDEANVDCLLIIHMKELPPPPIQEKMPDPPNLNPNMSDEAKEDIRHKLFKLREDKNYRNAPNPDLEDIPNIGDTGDIGDTGHIENKVNIPDYVPIKRTSNTSNTSNKPFMNAYFFVGLIFLGIFAYIFYKKKIKKS